MCFVNSTYIRNREEAQGLLQEKGNAYSEIDLLKKKQQHKKPYIFKDGEFKRKEGRKGRRKYILGQGRLSGYKERYIKLKRN